MWDSELRLRVNRRRLDGSGLPRLSVQLLLGGASLDSLFAVPNSERAALATLRGLAKTTRDLNSLSHTSGRSVLFT
jgi:hypothetical protein